MRAHARACARAAGVAGVPCVAARAGAGFHLNDRPHDVAAAAGGAAPAVVAHAGNDAVLLLDPKQLQGIGGDLEAFGSALETARLTAGLDWPGRQTS